MGQEKSLLAALVAALSALAHCQRGQAQVHCGEAQGPPAVDQCPLRLGSEAAWGAAGAARGAAQGAALETERGLCHDSWGQVRDPGLAVMGWRV